MRGLRDKAVLVTGGASGIGRAICGRLGAEGATVGIFDIDGDGAEAVAGEIRGAGGRAQAFRVDITDYEAVREGVETFAGAVGRIDGLVNNAGWDRAIPFLDTDREFWKRIVDLNLYGPLNLCHVVLRRMADQGGGRVVNIASDAGRVGSSGEAVYSACKGGIVAFTKTMARELARKGVILNAVCPGPTDTALLQGFDDTGKLTASLEKAIPMRRLGRPEDYPGLVAFLLSDDAGFITGQAVSVSGGLTMHG